MVDKIILFKYPKYYGLLLVFVMNIQDKSVSI